MNKSSSLYKLCFAFISLNWQHSHSMRFGAKSLSRNYHTRLNLLSDGYIPSTPIQETATNILVQSENLPSDFRSSSSVNRPNLVSKWHNSLSSSSLITSESTVSDTITPSSADAVVENVSPYSKVDKTGFIGFFANFIEIAIDFGHNVLNSIGVANSYGYSIIMFTILVKALILPLTKSQLESTSKMQKLTPLQQKISQKYANDEATKNQLLSQLFQAANVNPLAGCLPALIQIPIFISLYRALTNLVAENKLSEPFLWIPDLEGPVYSNAPSNSMNWIQSIFTGEPVLGWHDTLCFLSLPLILFISQTLSQKVLQPPRDPNKQLTEQEEITQGIVNNLPFIVAFFSINVPAGLAVYWIINNLLTTALTVALKSQIKVEDFPLEVTRMMELVDGAAASPAKKSSSGSSEMNRKSLLLEETLPRKDVGFGSPSLPIKDAEMVDKEGGAEEEADEEDDAAPEADQAAEAKADSEGGKRKKRAKPAATKKNKRRAD